MVRETGVEVKGAGAWEVLQALAPAGWVWYSTELDCDGMDGASRDRGGAMFGNLFLAKENQGELGQALNLGLNCAVGMAVFSFLGYWLDERRGGDRLLFTLLGMTLGLAYGAYEVWKVIRMLNRQCAEACRKQQSAPGEGAGADEPRA